MRLHARITKPEFYTDGDLLRWDRGLRSFYRDLWHIADDSGCCASDPFEIKLLLYPSPRDADITEEVCKDFVRSLSEAGKLIHYESGDGKLCFYIKNWHHQRIDNPAKPEVPLPAWITWEPYESNPRAGKYILNANVLTEFLQSSDDVLLSKVNRREVKRKQDNTCNSVPPPKGDTGARWPLLLKFSEEISGITEIPVTKGPEAFIDKQEQTLKEVDALCYEYAVDFVDAMQGLIRKQSGYNVVKKSDCPAAALATLAGWLKKDSNKWEKPKKTTPRPIFNPYTKEATA